MKQLTINRARTLGKDMNAKGIVILAFGDDGECQAASYGRTKQDCGQLGKWLDGAYDAIESGWAPFVEQQSPEHTETQTGGHGVMSEQPDLLPCPFCGGEASYHELRGSVSCQNSECYAVSYTSITHPSGSGSVEELPEQEMRRVAYERWNKRAPAEVYDRETLDALRAEVALEKTRLAACAIAAQGGAPESVHPDAWSEALGHIYRIRALLGHAQEKNESSS